MFGISTFGLSMWLFKWFPMRLVNGFLLVVSRFMLGDTARYGISRPRRGPLELKSVTGKTHVLDIGTLAKIRSGHIKVCKAIKQVKHQAVEFIDGKLESFDAIILATGYRSNVMSWLKKDEPNGMIRIGRIKEKFIVNPTMYELNLSDLNLVYACTRDKTLIIDVQTHEISERDLEAGLKMAHILKQVL